MSRWNKIEKALQIYKSRHGDLLVPLKFVIEGGDESWPEELWGIRLGSVVIQIRSQNYYSAHKDDLMEMGFDYLSQRRTYGWAKVHL